MLKPQPRGVTLIELMVTVTILGFMLLAALPSMGAWMRNTQIRTVAESLLSGLGKARNEAVRRNSRVMFSLVSNPESASCTLSPTSASWIVSLQSPANACDVAAGSGSAPMPLEKWAQSEGSAAVTLSMKAADCTSAASTTQVQFNGFGRLDTGTVAPIRCIDINHASGSGNRALRITINPAGAVRMCDPGVTAANDPRRC